MNATERVAARRRVREGGAGREPVRRIRRSGDRGDAGRVPGARDRDAPASEPSREPRTASSSARPSGGLPATTARRRSPARSGGRRPMPERCRAWRLERDRDRHAAGPVRPARRRARARTTWRRWRSRSSVRSSGSPPGCRTASPSPTAASRSWTSDPAAGTSRSIRAVAPARGCVARGDVGRLGHRARRPALPVRCGRGSRHARDDPLGTAGARGPRGAAAPAIARRSRRPSTQASTRALR